MRITESKLRKIIRNVILESESNDLKESILSSAKDSFKKAIKKLGNISKNDIQKHYEDYPEYVEDTTGGIKTSRAQALCKEYFQFAKNNDFDSDTNGKFNTIKWLKSMIKNNSDSEDVYELFIERLYLKIFEDLLERDLITTSRLNSMSTVENWRWNNEILYSRDGKKRASY